MLRSVVSSIHVFNMFFFVESEMFECEILFRIKFEEKFKKKKYNSSYRCADINELMLISY